MERDQGLEGIDPAERVLQPGQVSLGRRRVVGEQIDFGAVSGQDVGQRSEMGGVVLPDDGNGPGIVLAGAVEDEMPIQEILELGIFVELLTQQSAAPSAVREEIDQDVFSFGFGFSQSFVQRSPEPGLGSDQGDKAENSGS